jgi:hypothetical protein
VRAALTCLFSALSYAELASSIPTMGSAYTYADATLGEVDMRDQLPEQCFLCYRQSSGI